MTISPKAVVHEGARIGKGVRVDAFAVIEKDVHIGDNTWIGSHAMIMNGSRVGGHCRIFPAAIIGGDPQDRKYAGEKTEVIIKDYVTIREFVTINRGTKATGITLVKDNALIMAYAHIAHDCIIEQFAVVSNAVNLAGHVAVGQHAIIGGLSAVQQFVRIGSYSFVGGGTLVRKDVPPFIKAAREPLSYVGVNAIGLRRAGFHEDLINHIGDIYRVLFVRHKNISIALDELKRTLMDSPEKKAIVDFVHTSQNGLIRGFRKEPGDDR